MMGRCVQSSPNLLGMAFNVDKPSQGVPVSASTTAHHQTPPRSPLTHHSARKRRDDRDRRSTLSPTATTTADGKSIFRSFQACYEMDLGAAVGTGGYAMVRRATHRATGQVVAVKIMSLGRTPATKAGCKESGSDSESSSDEEESSSEGSGSESGAGSLRDTSISYQEVCLSLKGPGRRCPLSCIGN